MYSKNGANGTVAVSGGGAQHDRLCEPNWASRLWTEVLYRWGIAVTAPTRERAREMEHARIYAEQHRLAEEYSQGYLDGWHECYAACLDAVEDEVSRKTEIWAVGEMLVCPENSLKTN